MSFDREDLKEIAAALAVVAFIAVIAAPLIVAGGIRMMLWLMP